MKQDVTISLAERSTSDNNPSGDFTDASSS
jgi:hypothetical protein